MPLSVGTAIVTRHRAEGDFRAGREDSAGILDAMLLADPSMLFARIADDVVWQPNRRRRSPSGVLAEGRSRAFQRPAEAYAEALESCSGSHH